MSAVETTRPRRASRGRLVFVTLIIVTVIAVFVALQTNAASRVAVPDETPALTAADAPAGDHERTAFFAFGNAVGAANSKLRTGEVIEMRLPFQLGVTPDAFRIRLDNVNYLEDERLGDFTLESLYIGTSDGAGNFIEAVRLSNVTASADSTIVTGWFDKSQFELLAGQELLLGVSLHVERGKPMGTAPGVAWTRVGVPNGPMTDSANLGRFTTTGTFLDIDLEYTIDAPREQAPIVAVIGHSLNAGANENRDTPHFGENSAWHQVWAREHGAAAASLIAAGSWTPHFVPESPKWYRAAAVDADILALWASSSDLVVGTDPSIVEEYWQDIIDEAHRRWPGIRIIAFTEPPRGAEGLGEQFRHQWNAFLRSMPPQIDALVDADALLADPSDPTLLAGEVDGDGDHFSPRGHQIIADAFAVAVESLRP